jgi:uncharacterized protein (DUF1697 family)
MITYISILRGINVSGKNIIRMNLLTKLYETIGFTNVHTFIQSGNVVFQSDEPDIEKLERDISEEILKQFSLNVPVFVKEKSELARILQYNPFLMGRQEDITKLYITFLSKEPDQQFIENVKLGSFLPDEYFVKESSIYLYCPNGYGRTKLSNNYFENKLKVIATTRNLKTIVELLKICGSI